MKTIPFTDVYITLGAKMHEFAGFNMPIEYSGVIDEYMAVVNSVGVFDVSHMGGSWVKGPSVLAFVQSVASNDVSVLPLGRAQYTCFSNDKGGVVGDLLVCHYEPEKYLLVVNAGSIDKDWEWYVSHSMVGAELENSSDRTAQLAIQGPKTQETPQRLTPVGSSSIPYYSFMTGEFAGCKNVIISNTGYTDVGGFELYFYPSDVMVIWNAIFEAGKPEGIKSIGLGARDALHLEMGFCLCGGDPDDATSPIEAGLGWVTKFAEGKSSTNRVKLERQKEEGVARKLCAFGLQKKGVPRHDHEIADAEENAIGVATSDAMSPVLKKGTSIGYVKPELAKTGTDIFIKVRNKDLKTQMVKTPFRK